MYFPAQQPAQLAENTSSPLTFKPASKQGKGFDPHYPFFTLMVMHYKQHIKVTPSISHAITFVNYVIRTIETLKFIIKWETQDQ